MLTYLLRRILLMFPTLLGITIVVFAVMALSPGGISPQSLIEGSMKPNERQALMDYYNKRYGLDDPVPVQYLRWLNNVSPVGFTFNEKREISGFSVTKGMDFGESFQYGRPVTDVLGERLPITLLLNAITLPFIYIIAILIGVKAASESGSRFDVQSNVIMLALWSIPSMLAGVLLLGFFANVQHWQWFPTAGIGSREAQDMPYMPHWGSMSDLAKFFGGMMLGTLLMVWLSRWPEKRIRMGVAAAFGLVAGVGMAQAHGQESMLVWILCPILGVLIVGGLAAIDYTPMRILWMGLFGLVIGGALAYQTLDQSFVRGFLVDRAWHLVLPIICLTYGSSAMLAKLTRSAMLENLNSDYARTARAKGLPDKQVLWVHVFRNSLLPLITVTAGILPGLLAGSLIVENIFSINGMGLLAVDAAKSRDREMLMAITLISGFLTLIGYLITDILYTFADPRVAYD